jgi:hypothetical protein
MKHVSIIYIIIFFRINLFCQEELPNLTKETLEKKLIGYWKSVDLNKDEHIIVFNQDKTYQYFKNKKKLEYGTYIIDFKVMFMIIFNSTFKENYYSEFEYFPNYISNITAEKLQFGRSPVDGDDRFFKRMKSKEIDNFYGKKLLCKAFRKKSDKLLFQYFKEWQLQDNVPSDISTRLSSDTNQYHKAAQAFFSDFYAALLQDIQVPKYTIVAVGINRIGIADFVIPTTSELDSFVNAKTGYGNYRAQVRNEEKYNTIVKEDFWGRYFEGIMNTKVPTYDTLKNFMPYFYENENITYLTMQSRRSMVVDHCMRNKDKKYKNWYFIKSHLCYGGGVQYTITDTPRITGLTFNKHLNLAVVDYTYPYNWVSDLYELKDGKWQFYSTIIHMVE